MRVQARNAPHVANEVVNMNKVTNRQEYSTRRAGFSLMELLAVLALIGIMTGMAVTQYTAYLERTIPDRASRVVGSYISLTRSYAVQQRGPVTMAVDPGDLTIMIRTEDDTIRIKPFSTESELRLLVLDTNLDGDSLTFNARGMCSVCGVAGKGITVSGPLTSYFITFTVLGRWKRTKQ